MNKKLLLPLFCLFILVGCGQKATNSSIGLQGPSGVVRDERYGKEVWFSYGAVQGTPDFPANGLAKSHRFENGKFIHTLQVNIAMEKDGTYLEGWLENPVTKEKISTGHLQSIGGDARHALTFNADQDYTAFTDVIITLESANGKSGNGLVVATAQLKEIKRGK